jgi:hypothetical protein
MRAKQKDIAMQTRCIFCSREQYAPAVWPISNGQAGCSWCGKVPPVLTDKQYYKKLKENQKELIK